MSAELDIQAAVLAERKRCEAWAMAMRTGGIDNIRSVIFGIKSGTEYSKEDAE